MRNAKEIFEMLKDIISQEVGVKKIYDKDLAEYLGINHISFATMKKRGRIPYDKVLDFCAKRKISINWLFYDQAVDSTRDETEKYARIKYFSDIYASAGGGAYNDTQNSEYINVDEKILEKLNYSINDTKYLEAINVIGESMEPTLKDGNVVFVDKKQKNIDKGGIFILLTQNGLFIKRVQKRFDGAYDIISDNPVYPIETLSKGLFDVVGKVVGVLHKL